MPEIRTLKKVQKDTIHLLRVDTAVIHWEGDPYEGEYEVTPRLTEQTLETRHKTMSNNVTVHQIPITMTSNPQGGKTVLIG